MPQLLDWRVPPPANAGRPAAAGLPLPQRGHFVLHASSVAIDGKAAAFAGPSGRGKSTLVAALASAGHPLIADDMSVIDTSGAAPVVQPGFPRVKLWPDSASALA